MATRTACSDHCQRAGAVQAAPAPRAAAGPALRRCRTRARETLASRPRDRVRSGGPSLAEGPAEPARRLALAGHRAFVAFLRLQLEVLRSDPLAPWKIIACSSTASSSRTFPDHR